MVVLPQERSTWLILHPLIALPVAGALLAVVGAGLLGLAQQPPQGGMWQELLRLALHFLVLPASLTFAVWLLINSVLSRRGERSSTLTAFAGMAMTALMAYSYGAAIATALGPDTAGWLRWVAQNAGHMVVVAFLPGLFALLYLRQYLLEKAQQQYEPAPGYYYETPQQQYELAPGYQIEEAEQHYEPPPSHHQPQRRRRKSKRRSTGPALAPLPEPPARWTPQSAVVKPGPSWDEVILPEATKYALMTAQRILQDPESFRQQFNAEPPRGIILYGPPGTGKTLIARTLATSAGYHFITASPAELNQMYLGQGEKVVAELYERARRSAPCVVFLDEVDAVAAPRSAGADPGGGGRSQNSLLNQLLQELDGFHQSPEMVFTIAATNRLDNLDPAFKSRFGSQIEIGLPDDAARLALLKLYTQGYRERLIYPLGRLVIRTKGMGGRDITNICRQAALYTFGTNRLLVGYFAFAYAFEQMGRPLANAVIQKSVAETWAGAKLGEAELLARAKAHFGALLTELFKAEGKSLEAKAKSVAERLSEGQVGALLLIAGLKSLKSPAAFIEDCRELEEELHLVLNEPSERN